MNDIPRRMRRAAEGILGNERLTADLDDQAAQALIDWGIDCAEKIAQETDGLNDLEAEQMMYPRLRALRRLMRGINRWVARRQRGEAESSVEFLREIFEQAKRIYAQEAAPPDDTQLSTLAERRIESASDPVLLIHRLRELVENRNDATRTPGRDNGGQEIQT